METDEGWMRLALEEARKGIGLTSPNPPVGAVIVKDDSLLGKGWHQRAGLPHAEREAIASVRSQHGDAALKGATLYVTLEPCSTVGKTPACTDGIIEAGITRVVYGSVDPNPAHVGHADYVLSKHGVEVNRVADAALYDQLIRPFAKVQRRGLPWVILKSAMSLDGKITRPAGEGQWLTSELSRSYVQRMRHRVDAVLTGGQTLRMDDPSFTIRDPDLTPRPQPWRMIVTRGDRSRLPAKAQVFHDAYAEKTLVQENGDLEGALKTLVAKGCCSVLVEAGGTLMAEFLHQNLADEVALFYAPLVVGTDKPAFAPFPDDIAMLDPQFERIGDDVLLTACLTPVS